MKRLLYYLRNMENTTSTYKEMYEGEIIVYYPPKYDPLRDEYIPFPPEEGNSNIYYSDLFSFSIEQTHKLAQDRPTVVLRIPCRHIGITVYSTASADYCLREFIRIIDVMNQQLYNRSRPEKENGKYEIYHPSGKVLKNNAVFFSECPRRDYEYGSKNTVYIADEEPQPSEICLCFRLMIQLPFNKIRKTIQMFSRDLPAAVAEFINGFRVNELSKSIELSNLQNTVRKWLYGSNYCAFIANGSVLPRKGETDDPDCNAVPFQSPAEDEIEIFGIRGMGVRKGVTVITGGGYSGKSTLLDAIAAGVYNHTKGDGRELCVTDESALTISAEDGRSVKHVNISPFIKWIPGKNPADFSTEHASGATSQAANIMEAIDCDVKLLLIDEDRSATNFMIRDPMMKKLIEKEPITPYTDRVRELFQDKDVSTILVIGGSGEYLSVADNIYVMRDYQIENATWRAKAISRIKGSSIDESDEGNWKQNRLLKSSGFTSYPAGKSSEVLEISDASVICVGDEKVDVRSLHDLVSIEQLNTIAFIIRYLMITNKDSVVRITESLHELYEKMDKEDIEFLYSSYFTTSGRFLVMPRKQEVMEVINRMRQTQYINGEGIG